MADGAFLPRRLWTEEDRIGVEVEGVEAAAALAVGRDLDPDRPRDGAAVAPEVGWKPILAAADSAAAWSSPTVGMCPEIQEVRQKAPIAVGFPDPFLRPSSFCLKSVLDSWMASS